jgi:hypothetical protein
MFKSSMINSVDAEHPVVPIVTEHAGLLQKTEFYYTLGENGKRCLVTNPTNTQGLMRRRMVMNLPLSFSPDTWVRHRYALADVIETLNYFRALHLWQLAVLLGIPLSNSAVKLSFAIPTSMVFSSKAIVLMKIANHLRQYYTFPKSHVLDKTKEDHVPPLPVHRIPSTMYQEWKLCTPVDKTQISMLTQNKIERLLSWNNIQFAPMYMEGDYIYTIRVVSKEIHDQSGREADSLATKPVDILCADKLYCGLYDEAVFFLPE